MAIRFLMSGGQFIFSSLASAGVWAVVGNNANITASGPAGRSSTYVVQNSPSFGASQLRTPNLGANYSGLIAGYASWVPTTMLNNSTLIGFWDNGGVLQCDLRYNATGQLFFTRNGTTIGSLSTFTLTPGTWVYAEFKSLFSIAAGGTCEARINSGVVLTATSVTNATTAASACVAQFMAGNGSAQGFDTDFYVLDTGTGTNTSYLGDISVVELFPNGAGTHSAWAANIGPLTGTAVAAASGGNTVYTYTTIGLATSALVGYNFVTSGYASANNGTFTCTASTATTVTLNNAAGIVGTTGSIAFQNPVQIGINSTGTRPNGDVVYLADSTTNDISDFAHTPLTLTGSILGVAHQSCLRKDDAGARSVAQVCVSGATTEVGTTRSLGNTYQFYQDILELDPNTSAPFTVSGLNACTFGVKEIS